MSYGEILAVYLGSAKCTKTLGGRAENLPLWLRVAPLNAGKYFRYTLTRSLLGKAKRQHNDGEVLSWEGNERRINFAFLFYSPSLTVFRSPSASHKNVTHALCAASVRTFQVARLALSESCCDFSVLL
jgi:hypothetical protein